MKNVTGRQVPSQVSPTAKSAWKGESQVSRQGRVGARRVPPTPSPGTGGCSGPEPRTRAGPLVPLLRSGDTPSGQTPPFRTEKMAPLTRVSGGLRKHGTLEPPSPQKNPEDEGSVSGSSCLLRSRFSRQAPEAAGSVRRREPGAGASSSASSSTRGPVSVSGCLGFPTCKVGRVGPSPPGITAGLS